MEIRNKRLNEDEFLKERNKILATWPTGSEVDLEEAIAFHKSMPLHKNFALKLLEARDNGATLIRCESGVPTVEEFSSYLRFLQDEGQADLLGAHVDSMTRNQRYKEAERGLEESLKTGKWVLNGFPMIAHGVRGTRKLVEAVDLPIMIRNPSVDQRLVAEIGFASGFTGGSGCPILAFSQYSRNIPFEVVISYYQYLYRLMGYYAERGVVTTASIIGGFAILCPLSVLIAGAILDSLIAAEQGVKNINLVINAQGNLVQDVAAIMVLRKTARKYLDTMGYKDPEVTMNLSNWSGQFPADTFAACAIISLGVTAAVMSKSELCSVKTIEEAKSIPTREASAASLRLGKTLITMLKNQDLQLDGKAIEAEAGMLERETELIVEKALEMGDGDAVVGEIRATKAGVFDVPFSTSQHVQCRVKGVRDNQGAVRYIDHGNLPFTREIIDFHREKIAEREKAHGKKLDYQTIVEDISSIARGEL
jgi:methylaspartate mutase epsilon subunit